MLSNDVLYVVKLIRECSPILPHKVILSSSDERRCVHCRVNCILILLTLAFLYLPWSVGLIVGSSLTMNFLWSKKSHFPITSSNPNSSNNLVELHGACSAGAGKPVNHPVSPSHPFLNTLCSGTSSFAVKEYCFVYYKYFTLVLSAFALTLDCWLGSHLNLNEAKHNLNSFCNKTENVVSVSQQ